MLLYICHLSSQSCCKKMFGVHLKVSWLILFYRSEMLFWKHIYELLVIWLFFFILVRALQSLKSALSLPLRFGWNGDPCVPQQHPWSGADCHFDSANGKWFIDGLYCLVPLPLLFLFILVSFIWYLFLLFVDNILFVRSLPFQCFYAAQIM